MHVGSREKSYRGFVTWITWITNTVFMSQMGEFLSCCVIIFIGFHRNLFPWKSHKTASTDSPETQQQPGWKLFGKGAGHYGNNTKGQGSPSHHMEGDDDETVFPPKGKTHPPSSGFNWRKRHSGMRPATSTTALILENRPQ